MTIALIFLGMTALIVGFYKNMGFEILIEIKLYSNPYFNVGLSFMGHEEEDHIEEEFVLGLFFFNIVIIFYKPID